MSEEEQGYFDWLCGLVCGKHGRRAATWNRLLLYLYRRGFTALMDMDENRAMDGLDLRREHGYISDRPCSVLEMMVALSRRCEVHIMSDPEYGDRTPQWFWEMVENLGLGDMDNYAFDESRAARIIDRFLARRYRANGKGGLFTIPNCPYDLRQVDIWYQMMWHLNGILA